MAEERLIKSPEDLDLIAKSSGPLLGFAFGFPPEEAVKFFEKKGYRITWDWKEMWQEEHAHAFTVAKASTLDILQDIREEVDRSIREGITFDTFRKDLEPILKAKGWWGKETLIDEEGVERTVIYGTPWRLATIFNANVRTADMAGRYKQMVQVADEFPYWQYITAEDPSVRPEHWKLHGKVVRYDDPFWDYYYPPNGWGCRCRVRALTKRHLERMELKAESPEVKFFEWTNKVTGEVIEVPEGCDPGWGYNVGKAGWEPDAARWDPDIRKLWKA